MSVVRIYYCDTLVSNFPGVCLSAGVERRPLVVSLHARPSSEPAVYIVHFLQILFCFFFRLLCFVGSLVSYTPSAKISLICIYTIDKLYIL